MKPSKRKIHIIDGPTGDFSHLGDYEICFHRSLKPLSKFRRIERSIAIRFCKQSINQYFDSCFSGSISDGDTVIVLDSMTQNKVIELIDEQHTVKRKIYVLWNPCTGDALIENLKKKGWEVWTFDPKDAREFGLLYAGQFMPTDMGGDASRNIESDIFFVGIDKGRFKILDDIARRFAGSLKLNFKMVSPVRALFNKKYSARIPYSRCVEEASKSKAILDLTQEGQAGLTLRVLESLFLNKKVITNNRYIKNYSFFNNDNIFVIDSPDMPGLREFISKDAVPQPGSLEKYTYVQWLWRIINGVEMDDYNFA